MVKKELNLVCTQCKRQFPLNHENPRCASCNEPLEVEKFCQGRIKEGETFAQTILERYADFFPFIEIDRSISLHEGFTPLVRSKRLASEIGLKGLFFKNETQNPTWSFKDRGTAVGLQHAATLGYKKIGTLSTGNMAVSVAAYGARAGFDTVILVTADLPSEKLGPIAIHGSTIIRVDGDYGKLYFDSLKIGNQHNIYFISSDVPFRVEGSKTIAFEICEQMSFEVPDYVVVPTSAGGNIRGVIKGFEEFKISGMISKIPTIVCAQSNGCSPINDAFSSGRETISRFENPNTLALAIGNPYPPSGNAVLRKLRDIGGLAVTVTDTEIIQAQRELAQEGIFGQPASAVPLAAVRKLKDDSTLAGRENVVCIVTGSGLKYSAALEKHDFKTFECKQNELARMLAEVF